MLPKGFLESPKKCFYLVLFFALGMLVNGTKTSLDIRYFYDQVEANFFLHSLSPQEVQSYIRNEWIDMGFTTSYSLLFFALLKKLYPETSVLKYLGLLPGVIDLVENSEILNLLYNLDQVSAPAWLGYVTNMKWNTGIVVVAIMILRVFKNRTQKKPV